LVDFETFAVDCEQFVVDSQQFVVASEGRLGTCMRSHGRRFRTRPV